MEFAPVAWKLLAAVLVTLEGHTALNQTRCDFFTQYIDVFPSENKTITSPNYPLKYPNNEQCRWRFDAGSDYTQPDYVVKVTFNDLILSYTEDAADNCLNDKLEFRDGGDMYSQESKLIGKYCYKIHPEVIYSSGRYLHVNFQSNSINTYKGFSITVSSVKAVASEKLCLPGNPNNDNLKLTGLDGTLQTPMAYYPPDLNCDWLITVPKDHTVELSLTDLNWTMMAPMESVKKIMSRFLMDWTATARAQEDYVD